jgi:predicted dinucleotide-binding enzyme
VVDAGNYYGARDGHIAALEDGSTTSTELTAQALPGARVVKAFNTLYWSVLRDGGRPPGDPQRLAIPLAGDDPDAKAQVAALIDAIGFDPLDTGTLPTGGRLQEPTGPLYNRPLTASQAAALIA